MFSSFINNYIYGGDNYNKFSDVLEYIPNNKDIIYKQKFDPNDQLIQTVENFSNNNIILSNKVIISLSGGVDSMVLTTILKYLGLEIIAIHINYNNRKESSKEQQFLEYWCYNNNITLNTKVITDIKRCNGKRSDYEYQSKKIRFDFYKEIIDKENIPFILLAHHKDDVVENIFANVCRGRYILDLAVIKEQSVINDVNIMRPLINYYKEDIYSFAHIYQVPYFKDTTPDWSVRGKYRNKIYPLLENTFSDSIKNNLFALSKQSHDWNVLISEKIIDPYINSIKFLNSSCYFNIENYQNYPICFWNVILMKIFYYYDKNCPSRKAINVFMNAIKSDNSNCFISLSDSCLCKKENYNIIIDFKIKI